MDVLSDLVLLVGILGLDSEGVGTEVVTLGLEKVGGEVLGAVTVEPEIMLVDVLGDKGWRGSLP